MAQFDGKALLRLFLLATMLLLPAEGFHSYKGVRYSYGCTGWQYMGMDIKWKVGEYLLAPFIGLSYACESDACIAKGGMCKPSVCGEPCEFFCDKEHIFYSMHLLDDGNELPADVAKCTSEECVDAKTGVANIFCDNFKLKPDVKKKFTLHMIVDLTQEADDLPSRNKDSLVTIVAGNVNVSECTGSWKDGVNTIQAGDVGNLVVTLMDSYGNQVGEATGRLGTDLDTDFRPSVSVDTSGDKDSVSDVKVVKRGDTGFYDITFTTSRKGEFLLNVYAFTSNTEFFLIKQSPFKFTVTSGSLYVPACTGSWVAGGPIDPGQTVTLRVVLKDKGKEIMPAANYTFKAEVVRALGTRTFTLPVITSSETLGIPGSMDFVVKMETAGSFVLKIGSPAGDEQIEGSPFPFTVKAGPFFLASTKAAWPGGVNTFPAGVESFLRVLAVDKEGNIINPLAEGEIKGTVEKLPSDNRTLPDTPVTVKPEAPDTGYQLLSFVPKMIGKFDLKVYGSNGSSIPGSPFVFTVIPGFPSPPKSTGVWFNNIDKFVVGQRADFVITLVDAFGNNVTTAARGGSRLASFNWITSVNNQDTPLVPVSYTVTVGAPTDAGTQSLTFSPTASGTFALNIGTSTEKLQGSPFTFKVRAGDPYMAGCTASWLEATSNPPKYNAGSRVKMEVTQKDANKNLYLDLFPFTLKVVPSASTASAPIPSLSLPVPAIDMVTEEGPNMSQGKVLVAFTALASGEFKFHVGNGKTEINASPFTFIILPGPLSLSNTTGGWPNSKNLFSLGEKISFLITQRDAYGNPAQQDKNNPLAGTAYFSARLFTAGAKRSELQPADLTVTPMGEPTWIQNKLQFTTTQVGNFELEVYASSNKPSLALYWFSSEEDSSSPIAGSPFRFSVGGGDIYVPVCNASGTGLIGGTAGDALRFTISTYTKTLVASPAPASSFKVEFNPDVPANVQLTEGSGNSIDVQYRITVASGYAMAVKAATSSSEIIGSPFFVKISPGPLAIQDCSGHFKGGNPAVPVGKVATFIIHQVDSFGNKLYTDSTGVHDYTVKVVTDNQTPVDLDIKITPSITDKDQMLVTFNITDAGQYFLEVGDVSGSIKGSPFKFSAVIGVVITADHCTVQFVPSQNLQVGVHLDIVITSRDDAGHTKKSGNILEFAVISVPAMTGTPNPVAPLDLDNGTYVAAIRITSAGFVSFSITLFDEPLPGSPFEFEVEGGDTLPRAEFDDVWTWMNYPLTFNVLQNDYVKSGSPIFVKIDAPENGGMLVGLDGTMLYTPDTDYTGSEYLVYEMKDEAGEVAFGEVSITVSPPGQPYISAFPRSIYAFEDQPLPATGSCKYMNNTLSTSNTGMKNVEVACLETDTILSAELFALHGRVFPAADMFEPWQNVSVILRNDVSAGNVTMEETAGKFGFQLKLSDEITRTNDDSNALRFSARLEHMNAALKALQYMGIGNFNGNDTVYFTVLNPSGVGCTKSMSVYVRAVNDPPYVIGPSVFTINLSSSEAFGNDLTEFGVPISDLAVGDPDGDDKTGSSTYAIAGILQVESGAIQMTIPPSGYTTASYRVIGDKNWSSIPEHQIVVWGQGVRFKAPIKDWNTALQRLMFKSDNDSTHRVELTLVFDDLGKFGCVGDCTGRETYSYVAQHQTAIMIYDKKYKPSYKLKGFVKFILYTMGGIAGLLAVFYLAGKGTFNCRRSSRRPVLEFQEGEENYKMIRVYNPLWVPTYQKSETSTGLEPSGAGFEVLQDWKMGSMVAPPETVPPLGNESMPHPDNTWGGDGNSMNPSQGGGRARKFSVKWSLDGGRASANYGGTQDGPAMVGFGGPAPPPSDAFPDAPPGLRPSDPFNNAFGGFGFGNSSAPPPPLSGATPAASSSGEKPFTGFGDEDDDEDAPPPPQPGQSSGGFPSNQGRPSGSRPPAPPSDFAGASGGALPPPPPQFNNDPFSVSFNDAQVPPPPGMDNSFNVSFGDPPSPPPSFQ